MATRETKDGLGYIIQAISNIVEPKVANLRYDKTYRAKVTEKVDAGIYKVEVNRAEYQLKYNGDLSVGDIVRVKAPLNNFSDIYIEAEPSTGGGSGGTSNYNDLFNKPILNTNNTEAQSVEEEETVKGIVKLHKISKTGNYNDLNNKPSLDFIPISEKGVANGVATLGTNSKLVSSQLPIASNNVLGAIKVGANLSVFPDGTLNVLTSSSNVSDTLPIGSIVEWGSDAAPENWLICNGQELKRNEYPDLFAAIGTTYGEGDGSTTFKLPDMSSKFPIGYNSSDSDFNSLGKTGGEKEHTLTLGELPSNPILTTNTSSAATDGYIMRGSYTSVSNYNVGGNGEAHNNMPPYLVVNYIIKAKQSAGVLATVVDSLDSSSATDALSANQGKVLNDKINALKIPSVIDNLTSTSTTDALSANQGKVLSGRISDNDTMITNLQEDIILAEDNIAKIKKDYIPLTQKGYANGVAALDANMKLVVSQLPIATKTSLGAIKIGDNLTITNDGVLNAINSGTAGDITNQLLEKVYPVGSIYISANRVSPQIFLGGTWEPFAYGKTLVGVDDSESSPDMDFAEPLKTGGEKTHQLTIEEMPSHRHVIHGRIDRNQGSGTVFREIYSYNETGGTENNVESFATGGNKAHNNMQPYITVYMWRRIS